MRTGLSSSTVSRVLAGKANTSYRAREKVLACARELGVMDGMASGRMLLNNLVFLLLNGLLMSEQTFFISA